MFGMQEPLTVVDSEHMLSYIRAWPSTGLGLNSYLSGPEMMAMKNSSAKQRETENKQDSSTNMNPVNSPTFDAFHQHSFGEFNPNFYNPFQVKHRRRTTKEQYNILEASYLENSKPNSYTRRKLATQLNMTTRGVQVWFQNRRAKSKSCRRQGSPVPPSRANCSRLARRESWVSIQSSTSTSSADDGVVDESIIAFTLLDGSRGGHQNTNSRIENCASITLQNEAPGVDLEQSEHEANNLIDFMAGTNIKNSLWEEFATVEQALEPNGNCEFQGSSLSDINNYLHCLRLPVNQLYSNDISFSHSSLTKPSTLTINTQYNKRGMTNTLNIAHLYTPPQDALMYRRFSCPLPSAGRGMGSPTQICNSQLCHSFEISEGCTGFIRSKSLLSYSNEPTDHLMHNCNAHCTILHEKRDA